MTELIDNESSSGKTFVELGPKSLPPNVFIRGSSQGIAWIPDRSIRE